MKLPANLVIARKKVTDYLLVRQERSDKSAFLEMGGFTTTNPDCLIEALEILATTNDAKWINDNKFGSYFEVIGDLCGPADVILRVKTVWMTEHLSGHTKFITLVPITRIQS